jgi:nucleoside-diphosphate-sugar epimerase
MRRFIGSGGDAVILRPGIVYAPGGQWIGRLCRLLRARRLGDLGPDGDGFCNLIHAADVGSATIAALRMPASGGQAINLAARTPPRWNEVLIGLAGAIGAVPVRRLGARHLALEARLLAVPLQIGKLAGTCLGLQPGALPDPIAASLLRLMRQQIRLDHHKADQLLGFRRTDDAAALAACAAWFTQQNRVAAPAAR